MFAERLICALGLATGAFCQTYVQFSVDLATLDDMSLGLYRQCAGA